MQAVVQQCKIKAYRKTQEIARRSYDDDTGSLQKSTRKSEKRASIETYFFCDKPAPDGEFLTRKASTFGLDMNVRKAAMKLQEKSPLAKLSAGDLIAQDAQYHLKCLNSLYNRAREKKSSEDSDKDRMNHSLAFAELISYIEETRMDTSVTSIFKLSDLVTLYTTRLEQLGSNVVGRVHSTDLKKRILAYFLDMKPHKQGRDIILVSNECVGHALRKACEHDIDDEDVHLARAAKIVKRDMLKMKNQFAGSLEPNSQEESVPMSLLELVAMVLNIGGQVNAQR